MKKKIMYALMFALICICAIVIGKIKFSGTENNSHLLWFQKQII